MCGEVIRLIPVALLRWIRTRRSCQVIEGKAETPCLERPQLSNI